MEESKCLKCGKEVLEGASLCSECLQNEINKNVENNNTNVVVKDVKNANNVNNKKLIIIIAGFVAVILAIFGGLGLYSNYQEELEEEREREEAREERREYNSRPPKVDISMGEWYGTVEYILLDLGIDFDFATGGATCLTGMQSTTFNHEEYGVLHIEFRYCKSNNTQLLRIYNSESDQKLREPKDGEVPKYTKYGRRDTGNSGDSL